MDISTMNPDDLGNMLKGVDKALTAMTSAAANLGSISARIDLQTDFISQRSDTVTSGIGKLVDADMEAESSKLSALQTQQQLAIQSLSIANSSSQNILSLFRG
jgi:flagellin